MACLASSIAVLAGDLSLRWRWSPAVWTLGSVGILASLIAALYQGASPRPDLIVYAAVSLRVPIEAATEDFSRRTGRRVELHFGASEDILNQVRLTSQTHPADLFIPADDSYIRKSESAGLTAETVILARMRAVVLTGRGNPKRIRTWGDLTGNDVRLAIAEPTAAAIGLLSQKHLQSAGRWDALEHRVVVRTGNVTESANAVKMGTVDAAVVWDAVAANYPDLPAVRLPELDGIVAQVKIAVLASSRDPAGARALADFLIADDGGQPHFRRAGFEAGAPTGISQ